MAHIRKQKNGKFWVQIEKRGVRKSATWDTEREAKAWAKRFEAEIENDVKTGINPTRRTFVHAGDRYLKEVSSLKRGARWEELRIEAMKSYFGAKALDKLGAADISTWRDMRLADVSPDTVLREATLLRHIFNVSKVDWQWIEKNPFEGVRLPKSGPPRHQRWGWQQIRRILRFLNYRMGHAPTTKYEEVALAFHISLRTAMRASEVLKVSKATFNPATKVVTMEGTKSERRAQIPLTSKGAELCALAGVWTIESDDLDALFRKARDSVLLKDLRFHDARATALTLLARKVDVMTLARISRHKDLKILLNTYYRETAEEIAARMNKA